MMWKTVEPCPPRRRSWPRLRLGKLYYTGKRSCLWRVHPPQCPVSPDVCPGELLEERFLFANDAIRMYSPLLPGGEAA